jgi:ABC-type lipoprotein release transport system permease subunit
MRMLWFLLSLAYKNLTRYRRRTIITSISIAVGLAMFLIIDSILIGVDIDSVRNLKWFETSSLRVMHESYWDDRLLLPLDMSVQDVDDLLGHLRSEGYKATPRINFSADLILSGNEFGEDGNLSVMATAIDPESDGDVFRFPQTLVEGRMIKAGANEVVLGSWLAEDIKADVGKWVTLVTRGNGGFFEAMDVQIVGIVNCPNPAVNRGLLMVPIDLVQEYLWMEDLATEIDIALGDAADLGRERAKVATLARASGQPLVVMSWEELAADYLAVIGMERSYSSVLLFLVFIIAAVGISNTMIMTVNERTRELGMMRALGMGDRTIRLLFMFESGGIGLFGSICGIILGSLANIPLVANGIDFGFLMRMNDFGYRVQGIFRGAWSIRSFVVTFLAGIILSMTVAWVPTRRAVRQDIPSCLRHQ